MSNYTQTMQFNVADEKFKICYEGVFNLKELIPSYAVFYTKNNYPDDELLFSIIVKDQLVEPKGVGKELGQFDCGGINHGIYLKENGGYLILISSTNGTISCALSTTPDFKECEASIFGTQSEQSFGLNNALMISYAFSGAYHNIVLMHASVPLYKDYGILCLGKSGTGKSTHSSLWLSSIPETELLNDDNPVVRFKEETHEAIVYGSPWSGKTPCYRNKEAKIAAFLRLEQYPENIIIKEQGIKAFASILSSCSTMIWDKPSYNKICETVSKICQYTSVFKLKCLPNKEAADTSFKAIFYENNHNSQ